MATATASTQYPAKVIVKLELEIQVENPDEDMYLLKSNGEVTLGFLLDLFDMFKYNTSLDIQKVNGQSFEDLKKEHDKALKV